MSNGGKVKKNSNITLAPSPLILISFKYYIRLFSENPSKKLSHFNFFRL